MKMKKSSAENARAKAESFNHASGISLYTQETVT